VRGLGYLVCDKCHGRYRLKDGESPSDFSRCSCGGNLRYVSDVDSLHSSSSSGFRFNLAVNPKVMAGILFVFLLIAAGVAIGFLNPMGNAQGANSTNNNNNNYFVDVQAAPQNASMVVLGATNIQVPQGATVVTQVDRVTKDPASKVNNSLSADFKPTSTSQLVPWMEGARVKELMKYANVTVIPATNVMVKKINNTWYGPDDKGNYVYAVDPGKMTNLRSIDVGNNTRIATVTHGMNVMVPTAINNNASLVIACGDLPGKAQAEAYMNTKGINCYAPCDRFTFSLLDQNSSGTSLGTMPIRALKNGKGAVIGAQPISMNLKEKIIVQTTIKGYPDQYCDTPKRYFDGFEKTYNVTLDEVVVDANVGQTGKVVDAAEKNGANIIAVRVLSDKDKIPVEKWLKKDSNHRAVLFHSAAYEPGYSLFFEFPNQVTGDDTKPVFIKNISQSDLQNRFNKVRSLWQ
jgi:hypothetical protein